MKTKTCDICGYDDAILHFNGDRVCRDCFAGGVANVFLSQLDDDDHEDAYDTAMSRGYEDADVLINGGRLPY